MVYTLSPSRKALKHKWVFKNFFGNYIYKARLTLKGCAQPDCYEFDEICYLMVAEPQSIMVSDQMVDTEDV